MKSIPSPMKILFHLFTAGLGPRSSLAIKNLRTICEEDLKGNCEIEIFDLAKTPALARGEGIVVLPTLIKKFPPPIRRMIGDLSDKKKVLRFLDLPASF